MPGEMEKGSSSSFTSGGDGADSINSLKFGEKFYFAGTVSGARAEEAPPTSPAKKGRAAMAQGGQPPRCQVEGCKADLSDAKAYYCRHKVCGAHSKSPTVIVAGLEQRFCQQCSRFHQLPEFDQGKRSCRRRLAGHNERRRKPTPGPLLTSHYGTLSPFTYDKHGGGGGGLVMDFSSYSREQGLHPLLNPPPPADPGALSLLSNTSWTPPQNHFLEPTIYQGMASADMGLAAAFSNNQFGGFAESSSRHYHDEMDEPPLHHMHMDWSL